MTNQFSTYRTNGNTAYQPERKPYLPQKGRIIAFPGNPSTISDNRPIAHARKQTQRQDSPSNAAQTRGDARQRTVRARFEHLLSSSEMYCSLKYESLAGVKHNVFTKGQTALCFTVCVAIATVALIVGC